MPRRTPLILLLLGVLVLAGLGGTWWFLAFASGPLSGDTRHDFGTVTIHGRDAELRHVFTLVNTTGRDLEVKGIVPSCGCAAGDLPTNRIAVGEEVELEGILRLANAGPRKESLTVVLNDGEQDLKQVLWMQGIGEKGSALVPDRESLALAPGGEERIQFRAELLDDADAPAAPTVTLPDGLESSFGDWALVVQGDPARRTATRWRGWLTVRWPEGAEVELDDDSVLAATVAGAPEVTIRIVERRVPAGGD